MPIKFSYENHDETLERIFGHLTKATVKKKSDFRLCTLATASRNGEPSARTVVMREFIEAHRALVFYSDKRSQKMDDLTSNKALAVVFWSKRHSLQLRMTCSPRILNYEEYGRATGVMPQIEGLQDYSASHAPGTKIDGWEASLTTKAQDNFVAIMARFDALEWLFLDKGQHKRGLFEWEERANNAEYAASFLMP